MEEERNIPVRTVFKKKRDHGGHHGGAWKVAYADFVTAMMALFIVLWIIGQSEEVKKAIEAYFKDPGVFSGGRVGTVVPGPNNAAIMAASAPPEKDLGEIERLKIEAGNLQRTIESVPALEKLKGRVQMEVTSEGLRIDLVEASEGLFFDIGKAHLKPETVKLLKLITPRLTALGNDIVIEGYTDARPYASPGYSNWDLSADRANAARTELERDGLKESQIRAVRAFADRNLKIPDKPYDYRNRRVSIVVQTRSAAQSVRPARPFVRPDILPGKPK